MLYRFEDTEGQWRTGRLIGRIVTTPGEPEKFGYIFRTADGQSHKVSGTKLQTTYALED